MNSFVLQEWERPSIVATTDIRDGKSVSFRLRGVPCRVDPHRGPFCRASEFSQT